MRSSCRVSEQAAQAGTQMLGGTMMRLFSSLIALVRLIRTASAGGGQGADGFSQATSARAGLVVTGHRAARGTHRVESVVLGAAAALDSANLDDVLAGLGQRISQPGSEAAGSFQRPDPAAGRVLAAQRSMPRDIRRRRLVPRSERGLLPVAVSSTARSMVSRSGSPPMT